MDNYITASIGTCTALNHTVKKFCLPEKLPCDQTVQDGFFYPEEWNCSRPCKGDREYFWPVPADGKMMFQTRFNIQSAGSGGWDSEITIELFDINDVSRGWGTEQLLSRYVVGGSKYGFYQTVEVDFAKVSELTTCGYFVITYGEDSYTTQYFRIEPDCKCLVELEGTYTDLDCWNNYYGISTSEFNGSENFAFSNKIYVGGTSKFFGVSAASGVLTENQRVTIAPLIPPYMMRYISFIILSGKKLLINGDEFTAKDQVFTPRENMSMFYPIIDASRKACGGLDACSN